MLLGACVRHSCVLAAVLFLRRFAGEGNSNDICWHGKFNVVEKQRAEPRAVKQMSAVLSWCHYRLRKNLLCLSPRLINL